MNGAQFRHSSGKVDRELEWARRMAWQCCTLDLLSPRSSERSLAAVRVGRVGSALSSEASPFVFASCIVFEARIVVPPILCIQRQNVVSIRHFAGISSALEMHFSCLRAVEMRVFEHNEGLQRDNSGFGPHFQSRSAKERLAGSTSTPRLLLFRASSAAAWRRWRLHGHQPLDTRS